MPAQIDMWHRDHGGHARTTDTAYERIWFPRGWRKSPTAAQAAPEPTGEDTDRQAGESADDKEE